MHGAYEMRKFATAFVMVVSSLMLVGCEKNASNETKPIHSRDTVAIHKMFGTAAELDKVVTLKIEHVGMQDFPAPGIVLTSDEIEGGYYLDQLWMPQHKIPLEDMGIVASLMETCGKGSYTVDYGFGTYEFSTIRGKSVTSFKAQGMDCLPILNNLSSVVAANAQATNDLAALKFVASNN